MQFHEKKILIYLISRVFLPGLFQIFWPAVLVPQLKKLSYNIYIRSFFSSEWGFKKNLGNANVIFFSKDSA